MPDSSSWNWNQQYSIITHDFLSNVIILSIMYELYISSIWHICSNFDISVSKLMNIRFMNYSWSIRTYSYHLYIYCSQSAPHLDITHWCLLPKITYSSWRFEVRVSVWYFIDLKIVHLYYKINWVLFFNSRNFNIIWKTVWESDIVYL